MKINTLEKQIKLETYFDEIEQCEKQIEVEVLVPITRDMTEQEEKEYFNSLPIDNRTREQKIVELIRQKYSQDDECAILRKKLAGIDNGEFDKYNEFVEKVKKEVK